MPLPASVEVLLKQSATGIAALKTLADHKLDVDTIADADGAIAFFDPGDGTATRKKRIVVNTSKPPAVVAAYFCHEVHHARMNITGKTGDATKDDKDTYVEKMVQEEADGTSLGFLCYFELKAKGVATGVPPDRYNFFESAYKYGKEHDARPGLDAEAAGLVRAAKVARALINDRFLGANKTMSYAEYYAADWLAQRRKMAP